MREAGAVRPSRNSRPSTFALIFPLWNSSIIPSSVPATHTNYVFTTPDKCDLERLCIVSLGPQVILLYCLSFGDSFLLPFYTKTRRSCTWPSSLAATLNCAHPSRPQHELASTIHSCTSTSEVLWSWQPAVRQRR